MTDIDRVLAKRLHQQMCKHLKEAINVNIQLLKAIDEKPTLVQIFGSMASELHDILKEK